MIKAIEAVLRGYLFFRVNGVYFLNYTSARSYRSAIIEGPIEFEGYHIWKRWVGFFYRVVS